MSFEPEAVRAFEHTGWQRAASSYGNGFARATAPFITPLLQAAEISHGQHVLDVARGPATSRLPRWLAAPLLTAWTFRRRWLELPAAIIPKWL